MKTDNPLPQTVERFGTQIGRRYCLDLYTPAETALRNAFIELEKLGADPVLTNAGCKLQQVQDEIADWLEGKTGSN